MQTSIRFRYIFILWILSISPGFGQVTLKEVANKIDSLKNNDKALEHRLDVLEKSIDDIIWFQRVGDAAFIDKVYLTGPPLKKEKNPTALGAGKCFYCLQRRVYQ